MPVREYRCRREPARWLRHLFAREHQRLAAPLIELERHKVAFQIPQYADHMREAVDLSPVDGADHSAGRIAISPWTVGSSRGLDRQLPLAMHDTVAYKIFTLDQWAALNTDTFAGAPKDLADGFIMTSSLQLPPTKPTPFPYAHLVNLNLPPRGILSVNRAYRGSGPRIS